MFPTSIAGSLPKPGWLAETHDAMVPQVVAPLRLKGRAHAFEAQLARAQALGDGAELARRRYG